MNNFDQISELVCNDLRVKANKVGSGMTSNNGDRDSLNGSVESINDQNSGEDADVHSPEL